MEWAVEAAKRKNMQPAGGSRSIVETINVFNNIDTRLQTEATEIAVSNIQWVGKIAAMRDSHMLSPEHTKTFKQVNSGKEDAIAETPLPDTTPSRRAIQYNHAEGTPKSVGMQDNGTIDDNKIPVSKSPTTKLPPWSPYKTNNATVRSNGSTSTFEATTGPIPAVKSNGSTRTLNIPTPVIGDRKIDLSPVANTAGPKSQPSTKASDGEKNETSRLTISSTMSLSSTTTKINAHKSPNATINRMKRRSNMFVPLPKKDPLTVHDSAKFNQNHTFSGSSLRIQKQTNLSPKLQIKSRQSVAVRGTSRQHSPSQSRNVFDRLSSTSTKSFDKKISSKQSSGRKFTASSIDLSGSPMKRYSSRRTSHLPRQLPSSSTEIKSNSGESRMSETLKNIFSTSSQDPPRSTQNSKNDGYLATTPSAQNTMRRSLVPTSSKKTPVEYDKRHSLAVGSSQNSRASNGSEKNLSIIGEEKSSKIRDSSASVINEITEPMPTHNEGSLNHTETGNKDHRLTKFQLLRPQERHNDDLKQKLNKRLSEVMKNQQESEKQKKDIQRKRSINTLGNKGRTRNYSEFKSFRTSRKLSNARMSGAFANASQASENEDSHISKSQNGIDTRNILDALNTGDYRMRVGESLDDLPHKSTTEPVGNETLPEIFSDSDQEDTATLRDWARAPYLQEQLRQQQKWDYKKIFGPVAPIHLDEIFGTSRFEKFKTSSHTQK